MSFGARLLSFLTPGGEIGTQTWIDQPRFRGVALFVLGMKPSQRTEAAGPINDFGGRLAAKPAHAGSYIGGPETVLVACKNEIAYCSNSIWIFTAVGHDIVERERVWQHKVEQKSLGVLGGAFRNTAPVLRVR